MHPAPSSLTRYLVFPGERRSIDQNTSFVWQTSNSFFSLRKWHNLILYDTMYNTVPFKNVFKMITQNRHGGHQRIALLWLLSFVSTVLYICQVGRSIRQAPPLGFDNLLDWSISQFIQPISLSLFWENICRNGIIHNSYNQCLLNSFWENIYRSQCPLQTSITRICKEKSTPLIWSRPKVHSLFNLIL